MGGRAIAREGRMGWRVGERDEGLGGGSEVE